MAVAFDAATESVRTGTTDPHTFTHTPVGTPRGVLVTVVHGNQTSSLVNTVTYGGVSMTRAIFGHDIATEPGRAEIWFLGSGIPTGPQTVSIDLTSATTVDVQFVAITVTASGDTSVVDSDQIFDNVANPSLTMQVGGLTSMSFAALYGGGASPADFTPNASSTTVHDHDFGAFYAEVIRQTSVSSSDFTIGGTASIDDVAFAAVSITDVTNATVTIPTGGAAPSVAGAGTPDGADVTVGPSAAVATAACGAPAISTPAVVTVTPSAAVATASVSTPDGLDKAIGVTQAAATAAGPSPSFGSSATRTIDLTGIRATATAGAGTPEGLDITIGPSAAAATAGVVAPAVGVVGGNFTNVAVVAALAYAELQEEDPFPWTEGAQPPTIGVTVSPSAAAATAVGGAHTPNVSLFIPQATATASVGQVLTGRPVQPPSAQATAAGRVPTDIGDSVSVVDVAPQAARASASIVAPSVSVSIFAPQATATATGRTSQQNVTAMVTFATATAAGSVPTELSVTIGVLAASASASVTSVTFVKTGSAYIFALAAVATASCDRPRSVGVKNFVRIVPRPNRDTRMLTPRGSPSTLTLTPLEEQFE